VLKSGRTGPPRPITPPRPRIIVKSANQTSKMQVHESTRKMHKARHRKVSTYKVWVKVQSPHKHSTLAAVHKQCNKETSSARAEIEGPHQ